MEKFVVTFATKNMRHEMVSCIWSWQKKTEKVILFLIPFYISDRSLNRFWAILSFEKKVEVFKNPQLKSEILSTHNSTTLFCLCSFWWKEKSKLPISLPSQPFERRKCDLFHGKNCGYFCYQTNVTWWLVAFDFDQVNWINNFVFNLILSFRHKFGLFLKQCELSKKDWNF